MADIVMYEVIAEKYTGKHRVYLKGAHIPGSEIFGNEDVALSGQKDVKNAKGAKLPDVKPSLKVVVGKSTRKASK